MLTINNIQKLIGTKIDTTTAEWEVVACESRKNDYRIFINFISIWNNNFDNNISNFIFIQIVNY